MRRRLLQWQQQRHQAAYLHANLPNRVLAEAVAQTEEASAKRVWFIQWENKKTETKWLQKDKMGEMKYVRRIRDSSQWLKSMPTQVQHQNQFVFSCHIKRQISSIPNCSQFILESRGFADYRGHNFHLYKAAHLILLWNSCNSCWTHLSAWTQPTPGKFRLLREADLQHLTWTCWSLNIWSRRKLKRQQIQPICFGKMDKALMKNL